MWHLQFCSAKFTRGRGGGLNSFKSFLQCAKGISCMQCLFNHTHVHVYIGVPYPLEPHTHIGKKKKPINWFSHGYQLASSIL